ncbi:MAG TPA: N-6 DNA methylase, partial [Acidimicrobiales bacterium]|nr:N-6 DNA methylase [Acidimicrobiales bacterium]
MEPPDWVHDEVVSLSEFARLIPSHSRRSQTPENKAAALRMARRRDLAFPEPRVTRGRGEVFRLGDLVEWASARGLPVVFEPTWLIVHALRHTASALGSEAACLILAAELLRRPVDSEDERRPWEQGTRPPHDRPGVADRSPADRLAATVEFAIEGGARPSELLEAALEDVGPHASPKPASTPRGLAELLVAVGDPHPGELVEDPAIGQGEIAMAAARHAGGAVTITGGDVDPNAAFIAAARLQLAGVPFEADTGAQDALASESEHEGRADVVLLDPPFGPDMLPWVQVALRRAKTGGRAVVVLPMSALEPD